MFPLCLYLKTHPITYIYIEHLWKNTQEINHRSYFWTVRFIEEHYCISFSSVQSLSRIQLFATPWITAHQASLSITNSQSSPKLMSIESVMPSSHLILCRPLFLLPPIPPNIRVFSNESTLRMRWPKYWSFSFSIIPKKSQGWSPSEWTGWISLQSKELSRVFSNTTVQKHQFFGAQLSLWSNSRIHTGKTIALTRQTFVGKLMSLLFNMLFRLVITFLPRSKLLLISWLPSPSTVFLASPKIGLSLFPLFPHLFAVKWWDWMLWS